MSKTTKRKLKTGSQPARKRQKPGQSAAASNAETAPVCDDALTWHPVSITGNLEDAEGFYGLEEIDDVEVVRDESSSHVLFRPKAGAKPASCPSPHQAEAEPEEAWEGFDDDASGPETSVPGPLSHVNRSGPLNAPTKSKTADSRAKTGPHEDLQPGVSFDVLQDAIDEPRGDVAAWQGLGLSPVTLSQIARLGFSTPTPIQQAAIPAILRGHDVIGKAVTGSGKTLAFGLPIFEKWLSTVHVTSTPAPTPDGKPQPPSPILALIMAPTRELALQLNQHLNQLCVGLDKYPRICAVTGGLSIHKQQRQLEHADVVVATPGRLWEVMNDHSSNYNADHVVERLHGIQFLVVDEADRLLSQGHFKEVEDILQALDRTNVDNDEDPAEGEPDDRQSVDGRTIDRQTLVFSATFHKDWHTKLTAKRRTKDAWNKGVTDRQSMEYLLQKLPFHDAKPTFIDVNPATQMAATLTESIVECATMKKDLYLYALLMQNAQARTLVFANSISSVKRLISLVRNLCHAAVGLHSSMPQKSRLRSLEKFAAHPTVLVATDVAARGLDIPDIDLIIHYHVPRSVDMYVHRSGRTARAARAGRSVLLCSPDEVAGITRLIAEVHKGARSPAMVELDGRLLQRIQDRVSLAQKITEASQAKEKASSKDDWLKSAADELGVDFDSEEFASLSQRGRRGRGGGKMKREKEKAAVGKDQIELWRAELHRLLDKKLNLGVSERYLAGGQVDVEALLMRTADASFLDSR